MKDKTTKKAAAPKKQAPAKKAAAPALHPTEIDHTGQCEVVINGIKTIVPPHVAINLNEAANNHK